MKEIKFRTLTPADIEIRPTDTKVKGSATLLLYQTARCPMEILDDTVGPANWQVDYKEVAGSVYCGIGIQVESGEWIWKWNAGAEGNIGEGKSTASDALKRAATMWMIGRELYSTPRIKLRNLPSDYYWNDKLVMTFQVQEIEWDESRKCKKLVITDRNGKEVYRFDDEQKEERSNQGFYDLQHPSQIGKKSTKDALVEFCRKMKLEPATNQDQLEKFYRFYAPKAEEWKGTFQASTLWSRWMATAR